MQDEKYETLIAELQKNFERFVILLEKNGVVWDYSSNDSFALFQMLVRKATRMLNQ